MVMAPLVTHLWVPNQREQETGQCLIDGSGHTDYLAFLRHRAVQPLDLAASFAAAQINLETWHFAAACPGYLAAQDGPQQGIRQDTDQWGQ